MFLNTTGPKKTWVLGAVTEEGPSNAKETPGPRQVTDGLTFDREFLTHLPKMPSHCCRKDTQKMYVEPVFQSFADIYREYLKICGVERKIKCPGLFYISEIKANDISIFVPRKDQCDLCCEYAQSKADESLHNHHRELYPAKTSVTSAVNMHKAMQTRAFIIATERGKRQHRERKRKTKNLIL